MIPTLQLGRLGHRYSSSGGGGGGDPFFGNVVSLLHFDGTDTSTTFTDVTGKTWTARGNAQLDTTIKKFGTAAYQGDGTGDAIENAASTAFNIPANTAFTIEAWIYLNVNNVQQTIFSHWRNDGGASDNSGLEFDVSSTGKLRLVSAGTSILITGTTTLSTGQWIHVAASRNAGSSCAIFVNGVSDGTASAGGAFAPANTISSAIGGSPGSVSITRSLNGYIDDFRLTVGAQRYSSNFTPPTAAFPDS